VWFNILLPQKFLLGIRYFETVHRWFVWFTIRLAQFLLVNTSFWPHSPCFIWFTTLLSQQSIICIFGHNLNPFINVLFWLAILFSLIPIGEQFIANTFTNVLCDSPFYCHINSNWWTLLFVTVHQWFFCNSHFYCHRNYHWWTLYFELVYLCLMFNMIHHSLVINNSSWRASYFEPVHWCWLCSIVLLWQQFVGG